MHPKVMSTDALKEEQPVRRIAKEEKEKPRTEAIESKGNN
jgi:hypothetical protein